MAGFDDLFKALHSIPGAVDKASKEGLKRGAVIVMGRAKEKLGKYQGPSGGFNAWSKLSPETIRRKHLSKSGSGKLTRGGKAYLKKHGSWGGGGNDDSPLVDTGHLRQSITTDFSKINHGVAYVGVGAGSGNKGKGSPADYGAAQEFGYAAKRIPARPYLRPSLEESKQDIKEAATKAILEAMRGFGK